MVYKCPESWNIPGNILSKIDYMMLFDLDKIKDMFFLHNFECLMSREPTLEYDDFVEQCRRDCVPIGDEND